MEQAVSECKQQQFYLAEKNRLINIAYSACDSQVELDMHE